MEQLQGEQCFDISDKSLSGNTSKIRVYIPKRAEPCHTELTCTTWWKLRIYCLACCLNLDAVTWSGERSARPALSFLQRHVEGQQASTTEPCHQIYNFVNSVIEELFSV